MQEGLAQICLITASMTLVRTKIDQVIPRKRKGNVKHHEKAVSYTHLDVYKRQTHISMNNFNKCINYSPLPLHHFRILANQPTVNHEHSSH